MDLILEYFPLFFNSLLQNLLCPTRYKRDRENITLGKWDHTIVTLIVTTRGHWLLLAAPSFTGVITAGRAVSFWRLRKPRTRSVKAQTPKGFKVPTPFELGYVAPQSHTEGVQPCRCLSLELSQVSLNHSLSRKTSKKVKTNRSDQRPVESFREGTNLRAVPMAAPEMQWAVAKQCRCLLMNLAALLCFGHVMEEN